VAPAIDGLIGFQLAKDIQPDLILCDINMPKVNGYGVLQKIREEATTANTPFIFLTSESDPKNNGWRHAARMAGATLRERIANIPNWYFERVVFPKERLLFAAPPTAKLEIHQHNQDGTTLSDIIPCKYLLVDEVSHNNRAIELCSSPAWERVGDRQTA